MKPYQERVIEEKAELDIKREALNAFIDSDRFDTIERNEQQWLVVQADAMTTYSCVLSQRIQNFR